MNSVSISCETETYFILCYIYLKLHRTLFQNKDKLKQNLDHARLIVVHVHSFVDTKVWKQSLYIVINTTIKFSHHLIDSDSK